MICFTGMLFMGMYQLNKTKHAEIIKELKERRAGPYTHRDSRINLGNSLNTCREYRAAAPIKVEKLKAHKKGSHLECWKTHDDSRSLTMLFTIRYCAWFELVDWPSPLLA